MVASGPVSFGNYTFPNTVAEWRSNFGDGVPITTRLPGLSGGFPELGSEPIPTAIGTVTMGFKLIAPTRAAMDDLRDAVKAMRSYGMAKLIYQPTDLSDGQRYCWAHVHNISMPERKDLNSDLWQDVKLIFNVPNPVWYGGLYGGLKFGSSAGKFGAGLKFGSGALQQTIAAASTSFTVTNNGSTMTLCTFTLAPQSGGQSITNPRIQRIKNGVVVDEVRYTGTISYGSQLEVNGKAGTINLSGVNVFNSTTYLHPDFLRLEPGANSLRVLCNSAGDRATLFMYFNDAYL